MQPFEALVAMIEPAPDMRMVDLGCGTGELTAQLAKRFPDSRVLGIDSSEAMLAKAKPLTSPHVRFEQQDIQAFDGYADYDVIFSNAAFQWVPDNEAMMDRLLKGMKPGAQLAVQMPKNDDHLSHTIAALIATEAPFRDWLNGYVRESHALTLERYAELLQNHGLKHAVCLERIYGHELSSTADIVEWVRGTLLTAYLGRLHPDQGNVFVAAYRERLLHAMGRQTPYFYPFRRMLLWARKPFI
ncbi:MAG: methyltransferase domain-containing protein [Candidatus Sericytochromatia bacterium]|nr:methyltransferase domain-containing protein [Candidatus Sericytochromatia bacterium]